MTLRVGTVTIGQAPRVDVTPDLMKILGPQVELVEAGALDGLGAEQIAAMAPRPSDYVGANALVMDCMGYTLAMKEQVRRITGKPVILARSIAARALRELV